ncbi:putative oxidoreductase-like protein [Diaporthe ampelina]|uniref:Putative oxidoreductase-like protein n=1 Tax=Diaporthe ampelina TaxID=1214573 RepID=A0A0G2HRZ2_9PEZI|nr:putative oxidoreductase-like protein [Diaporthe ampelina]
MPNQGILSLCEAKKMGLTDFWKSSTDKRADEVRSGAVAPSRTERKRCWESRDAYFACLDRNNILDAIKDDKAAAKQCGGDSVAFETDCAAEWVTYFKKWRVAEHNKKQRLAQLQAQGAQNVQIQTGPAGS